MSKSISQEQYNEMLDNATYLQDEAEALRYVIDSVPYDRPAPENSSILEKLLLLDFLQMNYYRPVFEEVDSKPNNPIHISDLSSSRAAFKMEEEEYDIQKVLGKISKHRAALINVFKQIPLIDWEFGLQVGKSEVTLHEFAQDMIQNDRRVLKEIADMVMVLQKDALTQREIESQSRKQSLN